VKPLRWTAYAARKTEKREIDRDEIERTVGQPDSIMPGQPPRRIYARRYQDRVLQMEMLLRVVVEETATEMVVITMYKTSNFKKYGGSQ